MTEKVQQKVVEAYQIAAKGSFDHARMILEETLYDYPNSIDAWLLMADLAEDSAEARQCYQMVLEINPSDWIAQQRLKLLFSKPEDSLVSRLPDVQAEEYEEVEAMEEMDAINQDLFFDELMEDDEADETAKPTLKESFEAHRKLVLGVGAGILALLALGVLTWVVSVGYVAYRTGFMVFQ